MHILVAIKETAELAESFTIEGGRIGADYLEFGMNEWDEYALEAAVQVSEDNDDVDVTVVTLGPERSEETIRMALAKGADRAIRLWDSAFAEIDYLDIGTAADVLSAVVAEEDPDLVLTGVQSADEANGGTGVAIAERIDYEWAAVVNDLDIESGSESGTVHRELEGGTEEIVEVSLPAVLTIQTGINEPRYASLRGIRQAQQTPIEKRTLGDLGLDADITDSLIDRTATFEPEVESEAEIWDGPASETADELAGLLREMGVGGT